MVKKEPPAEPFFVARLERDNLPIVAFGKVDSIQPSPDEIVITEDVFKKLNPELRRHLMALEQARFALSDQVVAARQKALTDSLTSLTNLEGLKDHLAHLPPRIERKKPSAVSIVFIDLNDFKLVNTHFGHSMGDAAIRAVAQYFKDRLRRDDTVSCIARKGGDELVLTMQCSKKEAKDKLLKLKNEFSAYIIAHLRENFAKTVLPKEGQTPEQAWNAAVADYKTGLAAKHGNPLLGNEDLNFSFSFGAKQLTQTEFKSLTSTDQESFEKTFAQIIAASDTSMKEDKERHVTAMQTTSPYFTTPAHF